MVQRILHCHEPAKWLRRIAKNIVQDGDCWRWVGLMGRGGYGFFHFRIGEDQHGTGAHRASWLAHRGDIPEDLVVDHLCRNRWCVNPWHMELVTPAINAARRTSGWKLPYRPRPQQRKSDDLRECKMHGREDGYIQTKTGGNKRWLCRICRRVRNRQAYWAAKG